MINIAFGIAIDVVTAVVIAIAITFCVAIAIDINIDIADDLIGWLLYSLSTMTALCLIWNSLLLDVAWSPGGRQRGCSNHS